MLVNKDRPERGALQDLKNSRQKYGRGLLDLKESVDGRHHTKDSRTMRDVLAGLYYE